MHRLSSTTIGRLKQEWELDYQNWSRRNLGKKRYVYVWVDGVYSNVRMYDWLCLLVIIGADKSRLRNCRHCRTVVVSLK